MECSIRYRPAFATIFVTLQPREKITAEAGAMVSMDGGITIKTEFSGGFFPALMRRFFGGESLFVNVFQNNTNVPQTLVLSQAMIGDIEHKKLSSKPFCLQPGAYIAHTPGAKMGVRWAGFSSWFAGEGLFKLQFTGKGQVLFGSYGGLTQKEVSGDFVVDNSHLVAYEGDLKMNIGLSGNLLSSMTSGEGFVNRITGRGTIYLQSRSISGLVGFLRPKVR
ncbi:TIGR00266 family protein [Cyanobacterium stanieri LEGE 03274]|uniref:TIGR00266 family protein n=1 Tax=Cyanobacterium stanieri LEGE 03274 TaxID=1828756 RepID=A0ABR9V7P1_9CHRO|nr:TIGR00266 family protein [Cyanobacterium stanieri LEGE 03274]